jgi:hypothetical protein
MKYATVELSKSFEHRYKFDAHVYNVQNDITLIGLETTFVYKTRIAIDNKIRRGRGAGELY